MEPFDSLSRISVNGVLGCRPSAKRGDNKLKFGRAMLRTSIPFRELYFMEGKQA